MCSNGRSKKEIIKRICQAEVTFNKKRSLFTSIDFNTRKSLPTKNEHLEHFTLFRETWTNVREEMRRMEEFEMWWYSWTKKVGWTDKITNEEISERVFERKLIWKNIQKRQNELIGHILRHEGLLGLILEGMIDRKKSKRKTKITIHKSDNRRSRICSYQELKRKFGDYCWRYYICFSKLNAAH